MEHLKAKIREIPDFPKPGILFYDITTLLCDSQGFRDTTRMALQGHSWGGYQAAQLATMTPLFKAVWTGAPETSWAGRAADR